MTVPAKTSQAASLVTVKGGCHCGNVCFEVQLPDPLKAHQCNCSICAASGFIGIIVPASRFSLLSDPAALSEYRFNTGVARHWFCATCGVKSYYRPRSNPDGYNLNLNCLSLASSHQVDVVAFDGQNWEAHADTLRGLSRD